MQSPVTLLLLSLSVACSSANYNWNRDQRTLTYTHQVMMKHSDAVSLCASVAADVPHDLDLQRMQQINVLRGARSLFSWLNATIVTDTRDAPVIRWGISEQLVPSTLFAPHEPSCHTPPCALALGSRGLSVMSADLFLAPVCAWNLSLEPVRSLLQLKVHLLNPEDQQDIADIVKQAGQEAVAGGEGDGGNGETEGTSVTGTCDVHAIADKTTAKLLQLLLPRLQQLEHEVALMQGKLDRMTKGRACRYPLWKSEDGLEIMS